MGYSMFKRKKDAVADIKKSWQMLEGNFKAFKDDYETFNVVRVGRFLQGTGYYHETDEYYTCIGFEVEADVRFDFEGEAVSPKRETGFYSIWIGKASQTAPFTFEESYRPFGDIHRFDNGFGDHFEVDKELASVIDVTKALL